MKPDITEQDVCDWVKARLAEIKLTIPTAEILGVNAYHWAHSETPLIQWSFHANYECSISYPTVAEAVSEVLNKIGNPEKLAASKRKEAAKLLCEAELIFPTTKLADAPKV